ncbi:hypothetical protein ONS95_014069 [Cadophora gregata]|uniref:uncharacterized protein n=1 Tax=Cadophora gregata TaxID=51156 RepID=UPI0026DD9344|nr:uncharacterized protein ONS95_014069 [Cadophora gregata]KAK0113821.1 hypothetical protein ONS96_014675 [Cadophora gregata f. sp. sojae]KAK0114581.1 hypothetical protein ONS95_014069 [Cadophora gregata]
MNASVPITAKWGTACSACATAKSRCIRSNESSGKCDRCLTSRKDCTGQVHKKRKKREAQPNRTLILEEKLDSLVDLLKATPGGASAVQSILAKSPATNTGKKTARSDQHEGKSRTSKTPQKGDSELVHDDFPSKFSSIAPPTCICRAPVSEEDSHPVNTDEILLSIYKNQLCSWFPFVIVSPSTTAAQLQSCRPFLLKAIRLVASFRNVRSMWGQRRAIMQYLSEAVFVYSERSLDLLQGILVILGFYHYHCLAHIQFNNLMQLAISIVGDMDLNRDPGRLVKQRVLAIDYDPPRARTNDERRAVVGVWYMSSNVALTFNKGQSEKYTKYHDQCLQELEEASEYESDILLVHLVRIQHLIQRIADFNNRDQLPEELPGIVQTPASAYHAAFQTEIERHQVMLPPSLSKCHLIMTHFNTAQLRLYEPLLYDASLLDGISRSCTTLSLSDPTIFNRFSSCLSALKKWFEHWLTIPVCFYFHMSQPLPAQLRYSMVMLSQWALIFSPSRLTGPSSSPRAHSNQPSGRNPPSRIDLNVGEQIDILSILDTVVTRFEAAKTEMSAAHGGVWRNGIWDLAAKKIRMKRARIEKCWLTVESAGGEGKYKIADEVDRGMTEDAIVGPGLSGSDSYGGMWFDVPFGEELQDDWLWATDLLGGMDGRECL